MNQNGKTLMELMVVALLIGVAVALAVPNFLGLHARIQSRTALEEIASELRLARQLAISQRNRVRIVFDLEAQEIAAHLEADSSPHHVYRYRDKGITITSSQTNADLVFYPSGRAATAATIQLHSHDGSTRQMTVSMTGRVSLS